MMDRGIMLAFTLLVLPAALVAVSGDPQMRRLD
jgi:hypothetical protein